MVWKLTRDEDDRCIVESGSILPCVLTPVTTCIHLSGVAYYQGVTLKYGASHLVYSQKSYCHHIDEESL